MLIQEHMRQLVLSAAPYLANWWVSQPRKYHPDGKTITCEWSDWSDCEDAREWNRLWSQIKPVKFGNTVQWAAATTYTLADYQIAREAFYNIVLRVECYTVNYTNAAADYGMFEPPPPGKAFWRYVPYGTGVNYDLTDTTAQSHLLLDADEFKIFKSGYTLALIGNFNAPTDGATRSVRTLVYSYDCGPQIVERIGGNQVIEPPSSGL